MIIEIEKAYRMMQDASGIEIGDSVRVLRAAESYEMGWIAKWHDEMNAYIGGVFRVTAVYPGGGFQLENTCFFPFFVLQIVRKGDPHFEEDKKLVLDSIDTHLATMKTLIKDAVLDMQQAPDRKSFMNGKRKLLKALVVELFGRDKCIYCPPRVRCDSDNLRTYCDSCEYGKEKGICLWSESNYAKVTTALADYRKALENY
jgi:hypothetical protein